MGMSLDSFVLLEQKFLWLVLFLTVLYFWATQNYGFWSALRVPYQRPLPFFGNVFKAVIGLKPTCHVQQELYNLSDGPYLGTYDFMRPKLMLRDPRLIEHVMVKDFTTFMDRAAETDPNSNGLSAHLINMTGQKWRSLRNKLTPVFTSGKMKGMMGQLEECTERLSQHLKKEIEKGGAVEAKYQISGYTLDVIGSCAFGLGFNAIDDPNSSFRKIGERIFAPSRFMLIRNWVRTKIPKLFYLLNLRGASPRIEKYFTGIMKDTIRHREEQNIQRQDFIQLMMEIRKQEVNKVPSENEVLLDDKVMISNSFVFLLAGYETTASTISFMLYELAANPDIQEKLFREVTKVLRKHGGEVSWDSLKDMEYLEQVTSETLRKYPPATDLRRTCLKKYTFPNTDLEIPARTLISIPVYSLHHDPKYFPNPDKFDPERFSPANRSKIVKYTYLPFGDGPRICIGMRFAVMEIKVAVTRLIQDFTVKLNPRTISPLKLDPGAFLMAPVGGIWLDFSVRKTKNQ